MLIFYYHIKGRSKITVSYLGFIAILSVIVTPVVAGIWCTTLLFRSLNESIDERIEATHH